MIIVGAFMLAYVIFGGMLATTWVQIIKAVILMTAGVRADGVRAGEGRLQPGRAVHDAPRRTTRRRTTTSSPACSSRLRLALLSFGIAFVLGTAGLPHILVRFFTVPDAKAARGSVGWAVFLIGAFYLMVMFVGVGARAILGQAGEEAAGKTGNLAIPDARRDLGGGRARPAATSSSPSSRRSRSRRSSRSSPGS